MTRSQCKNEIVSFKIAVNNYRRVILNNDIHRSYDDQVRLIEIQRSQLNQKYGKLEKHIDKIGGGIGLTYITAFGDGPNVDVIEATSSVIQNLDRIIGRLDAMSDKEFDTLFSLQKQETIHNVKNPHKEYFGMLFSSIWGWLKNPMSKVIIGVIIIVIGAIVLTRLGFKQ